MKKGTIVSSALCIMLFAIGPTISSCDDGDYKTMSVKEGIQAFTFEYPEDYQLIRLSLENSPAARYTEVGLSTNDGDNFSEVYVYLWVPDANTSTAGQIMDGLLAQAGAMTDFNLLNNTTVMLGDVLAYQSVFTADSAMPSSDNTTGTVPRPATFRVTSIVFPRLAAEISMTCDSAIADATADDYTHLLDTFGILN